MEKDYSLLVAASVALVAIVGLVMVFGASSSGALYFAPYSTSVDGEAGYELGAWVAQNWNSDHGNQPKYCSYTCGDVCSQAHAEGKVARLGGDCSLNCDSNCNRILLDARGFSK